MIERDKFIALAMSLSIPACASSASDDEASTGGEAVVVHTAPESDEPPPPEPPVQTAASTEAIRECENWDPTGECVDEPYDDYEGPVEGTLLIQSE